MITTPRHLALYALALVTTTAGCFSTGKIKTSWPSQDSGTFPFCNPDDVKLTSAEPAVAKIGGTWLQKSQQGAFSTSTMLEFKTIGEDKYAFQMTAIGRVNVDSLMVTLIQESVNKMSGTAVAAGEEVLLSIAESHVQIKSGKTAVDLDNEKFSEEHFVKFRQGKIRMKLFKDANQIGTTHTCNIANYRHEKSQIGERIQSTREDTVFNADISQYKKRMELVSHYEEKTEHNSKIVIDSEGPAEVSVFYKANIVL